MEVLVDAPQPEPAPGPQPASGPQPAPGPQPEPELGPQAEPDPEPERQPGSRPAVAITDLHKRYGDVVAVDGVSLSVTEGEIFGILGPNGAGKTTTVECAIGLRTPDAGTVRLLGLDPFRDRDQVRELVGMQLQACALPAKLRVGEILSMYRSFYQHPADVDELTEGLGLAAKRREYYRSLSGGQRQRLSVVLALIGNPRVAVLDEMTTGLDPQARRDAWGLIKGIRDRGVTIVLVTHFMEEAERLCDRVAVIDAGRVVALDTPANLSARARATKLVRFVASGPFDDAVLTACPEVTGIERHGPTVTVNGVGDLVNAVVLSLAANGVTAHDIELEASNLEDAFVKLTGNHHDSEGV